MPGYDISCYVMCTFIPFSYWPDFTNIFYIHVHVHTPLEILRERESKWEKCLQSNPEFRFCMLMYWRVSRSLQFYFYVLALSPISSPLICSTKSEHVYICTYIAPHIISFRKFCLQSNFFFVFLQNIYYVQAFYII